MLSPYGHAEPEGKHGAVIKQIQKSYLYSNGQGHCCKDGNVRKTTVLGNMYNNLLSNLFKSKDVQSLV